MLNEDTVVTCYLFCLLTRSSAELKHFQKFAKTKAGFNQIKKLKQKLGTALMIRTNFADKGISSSENKISIGI